MYILIKMKIYAVMTGKYKHKKWQLSDITNEVLASKN